MNSKIPIKAIAYFGTGKIKGSVDFIEDNDNKLVLVNLNLKGLKKNGKIRINQITSKKNWNSHES